MSAHIHKQNRDQETTSNTLPGAGDYRRSFNEGNARLSAGVFFCSHCGSCQTQGNSKVTEQKRSEHQIDLHSSRPYPGSTELCCNSQSGKGAYSQRKDCYAQAPL